MRDPRCSCGGIFRYIYGDWQQCDECHTWVPLMPVSQKFSERLTSTMRAITNGWTTVPVRMTESRLAAMNEKSVTLVPAREGYCVALRVVDGLLAYRYEEI